MNRRARDLRDDESGVVAVEFVLVLPFILIFLFLIIEFGMMLNHLNDQNHIAGNGARYAAVDSKPTADSLQTYLKAAGDTSALDDSMTVCLVYGGAGAVGDPVTVNIASDFELVPFVRPIFGDVTTITLTSSATMRIERRNSPPTNAAGC